MAVLDPQKAALVRRAAAALARELRTVNPFMASEWLTLDSVDSPLIWQHLARAEALDIPLVAPGRNDTVELATTASAVLTLAAEGAALGSSALASRSPAQRSTPCACVPSAVSGLYGFACARAASPSPRPAVPERPHPHGARGPRSDHGAGGRGRGVPPRGVSADRTPRGDHAARRRRASARAAHPPGRGRRLPSAAMRSPGPCTGTTRGSSDSPSTVRATAERDSLLEAELGGHVVAAWGGRVGDRVPGIRHRP